MKLQIRTSVETHVGPASSRREEALNVCTQYTYDEDVKATD